MSGRGVIATFLSLSWACWGMGRLAKVHDGSNASAVIGWIGGLALTAVVLLKRARFVYRLRVRRWRSAAIALAVSDPGLYRRILVGANDNQEEGLFRGERSGRACPRFSSRRPTTTCKPSGSYRPTGQFRRVAVSATTGCRANHLAFRCCHPDALLRSANCDGLSLAQPLEEEA